MVMSCCSSASLTNAVEHVRLRARHHALGVHYLFAKMCDPYKPHQTLPPLPSPPPLPSLLQLLMMLCNMIPTGARLFAVCRLKSHIDVMCGITYTTARPPPVPPSAACPTTRPTFVVVYEKLCIAGGWLMLRATIIPNIHQAHTSIIIKSQTN